MVDTKISSHALRQLTNNLLFVKMILVCSIIPLSLFFIYKNINQQPPSAETVYEPVQPFHSMDSHENQRISKEAIQWLSVLKSYDERHLSKKELMQKFKHMSTAYTILCTTASGDLGIRFWSKEAIKYGRLSAGVMEGMMPVKNIAEESEVNTRLLIAMGMNYYGGGLVSTDEIVDQFEKIPATYLIRSGFCNNRILTALHNDEVISLPFIEL